MRIRSLGPILILLMCVVFSTSCSFLAFDFGRAVPKEEEWGAKESWEPVKPTVAKGPKTKPAEETKTPGPKIFNGADSPKLAAGYRLKITVTVAGEKEIDEPGKRIQTDGMVALPLVGVVSAEGKTLKEFTEYLRKLYDKSYFVDPQVMVEFVDDQAGMFPWGSVTVLGRVKTPGRVGIPPTQDLTVTQAISKADGFERYANESSIRITRQRPGKKPERFTVNMNKIGSGGKHKDMVLQPGDVVYVPEVVF